MIIWSGFKWLNAWCSDLVNNATKFTCHRVRGISCAACKFSTFQEGLFRRVSFQKKMPLERTQPKQKNNSIRIIFIVPCKSLNIFNYVLTVRYNIIRFPRTICLCIDAHCDLINKPIHTITPRSYFIKQSFWLKSSPV